MPVSEWQALAALSLSALRNATQPAGNGGNLLLCFGGLVPWAHYSTNGKAEESEAGVASGLAQRGRHVERAWSCLVHFAFYGRGYVGPYSMKRLVGVLDDECGGRLKDAC